MALAERIEVRADPAITAKGAPGRHAVRVEVRLRGGERLECAKEVPRGSERMAVDAARGLVSQGTRRGFAGASGVPFHGELLGEEKLGPHRAWRVRVSGSASYSGTATWIVEAGDRLGDGFAIEDDKALS